MIVVAGWLRVAPLARTDYLISCRAVVQAARAAPGCSDFSISPDLLDPGRVNVFERWESLEAVERFRGAGPGDEQQAAIVEAHVLQHTIADTESLT